MAGAVSFLAAEWPMSAQQAAAAKGCKVTGKATAGTRPLPGVAVVIRNGEQIVAATSTEPDGTYQVHLPPGVTYRASAELTGFVKVDRDIVLAEAALPCEATADLTLA